MSSSGDAQDAAARVAALESELEATLEAAVRREALNAQTIKRAGPPVHTRVWPFLGAAGAPWFLRFSLKSLGVVS